MTNTLKTFQILTFVILISCTDKKKETDKENLDRKSNPKVNNLILNDSTRHVTPFVINCYENGLFQLKLADLAIKKGSKRRAKKLAKRLIFQYYNSNNSLSVIAREKNISVPEIISQSDQAEYDDLSQIERIGLEEAYLKIVIRKLKESMSRFRDFNLKSKDKQIRNWTLEQFPIIELQIQEAEETLEVLSERDN